MLLPSFIVDGTTVVDKAFDYVLSLSMLPQNPDVRKKFASLLFAYDRNCSEETHSGPHDHNRIPCVQTKQPPHDTGVHEVLSDFQCCTNGKAGEEPRCMGHCPIRGGCTPGREHRRISSPRSVFSEPSLFFFPAPFWTAGDSGFWTVLLGSLHFLL